MKPKPTYQELEQRIAELEERVSPITSQAVNRTWIKGIIDAIPTPLAVVDTLADVIAFNKSWLRWSIQKGMVEADAAIGLNYLKVCDEATPLERPLARLVKRNLSNALNGVHHGNLTHGNLAVSNNISWFNLRARPLPADTGGAVIIHETPECDLRTVGESSLFQKIVDSSSEAIAISDRKGQIIYINSAHERLFGKSLTEARRANYRSYYPADSSKILDTIVAPALKAGKSWEGVLKAFDADGRQFSLWERADTVRDGEGRMLYGFGMMHDITEQEEVEKALRKSEALYRTIFDAESDAIFLVDEETAEILDANEAATQLYGYSRAEFLNLKAMDLSFEPDVTEKAIKLQKKTFIPTRHHKKKDGTIFTVEISASHFKFNGRSINVSTIRDTTQRLAQERKLRESEERFRLAFENANVGAYLVSTEGQVIKVNKRMSDILGYSGEEFLEMNISDFTFADDIHICQSFRGETLVGKSDLGEFTKRYHHKNGQLVWGAVTASLLKDSTGKPLYYVAHLRDVTDQVKNAAALETAKQELEKQVEQRTRALAEMNNALKVLLEKREQDKLAGEAQILSNVKNLVLPYLYRLKQGSLNEIQKSLVDALEVNLNEITAPFTHRLSTLGETMTPSEIKVADLVRQGLSNKEIAHCLCLSPRTITFHRENIRKKLGLVGRKVNLRAFLTQID